MRYLLGILLLYVSILGAGDLIVKESRHSVSETMDRLISLVKDKGLTVFDRIDHRKGAQKAGMDMNDEELLIFGNPRAGTRIMLNDPKAGLDLPMKILVYRDFKGKTWIVYRDPMALKKIYNLDQCSILPKLQKAMDSLTKKAAN